MPEVIRHEAYVKPTPARTLRKLNSTECKGLAIKARGNVKFEAIASALHLELAAAKRKFYNAADSGQLTYGDLFMLARDPDTREIVRLLVAPLLEIIDPQSLRLVDLENLMRSATGASTVLTFLRPTIERLQPLMNVTTTEAE